ncbi:FAD-dependent oxidoreductase [Nocardia alba]|uniref:2-polyprenyl-6-methoxyphenol hydroxylase-like FAD-dependent oxidoreductase n=1 Tax=Nocardia alba TaxID=225051 RepID=A0A4R1FGF0_9NOCA|nr:NAD(P)/FAD-dependent oxidoreductase [Nocardia alba]TCJ89901.1 2-polyprenyl-6-methoxyphenol hydroxylase-like FAD-dependent oxidoreductase [Nocardia alba]
MPTALIVGGGIAGPVAAIALAKAGYDVQIVERHHRSADGVGSFMNIAPNGIDAIDCLGLGDLVRAVGFHTPAMAFYRHDGRRLTRDIPFDRGTGKGNTTLNRADLYTALREEAESRGIPVHYGKALAGAETDDSGVTASFIDGTALRADLLVGADGLYSSVRQIIDPLVDAPRYLGVLNAWGYIPDYPLTDAPGVIRMFFNRKCFFMYTQAPTGGLYWYANPPRSERPFSENLYGGEQWRAEMLGLVEGDASPVKDIIAATPDLPAPFTNCDLPKVARWHRGNIVLVGDAAHAASPTSGSGASLAMEDAITLAKCVRDETSIASALHTYESLRRPRAEAIVAQGRRNIKGNTAGPFGSRIRDLLISKKFGRDPEPMWTHRHHIDWESPVSVLSQ